MNSHLKVIVQKFNAGPLLKDKDEPIDRRYFSTFRTILRTRVASDNVESQTYVTGIRKMPKFRTGDLEDNDEDKYVRPKFTKREEEIEINHDGNSNGLQQDKNANYKNNNTVEEPKALVIRRKPQLLGGPLEDDENAITEIKPIMNNAKNKEIKKSSSKGKKPNLSESEILKPESENLNVQGIRKKPRYLGGPLEDDIDVATKAEIEQIAIRNQKMMRRKPQYLGGPLVDDDFVEPSLNNELAETPSRFNSSNKKPEYGEGALEEDQGSENEIQHSTEEIGKQKQADIQHKKEEEEKARIEKDMAKSNDMDEIDQKDKQNKAQSEGPGSDKSSIEQATIIQGKISTDEADEEEQEELQEEKKEDENSSGKNTPKKITFKTAPEEGSVFNHEKTLRRRFRKKKLTNVPEAQEEDEERNKSGSRDPSLRKEINRSNSRELQTGLTASPGRKLRPVDSKNEVNPEQINKPYPFDMKNVKPRYMSSKGKDKEELENEEDSPSRNLKRLQTKSKTILNDAEDKNEDPERAASLEKSDEQEGNTAPNIKKEKEKEEKDKNKSYIAKRNPKKPVAKEQEVEQVEEPEVPYSTTVKTYSFLKAKSKNNESEVVNKLLDKQDSKDNEESAEPEAPYSTTIKTHKFLKAGSRKHAEVTKKEETIPKEIPQAKPELENLPKVKRIPLKNRFGQYRIGNFEEIDQVQEKVESNEDDTPKSLTLKKYQSSSSTDDNKTFKLHSIRPKGHISGDDSEDNTVKNRKLELGKLINQKLTSKDFMTPREKSFKTSDDEFRVESMKYSNSETERSLVKSTIFKLKKTKTQTSLADIDSPSRAKDTNEIKSGGKGFKISLPKFKSEKEIGTLELPPISAKGSGSKTQGLSSSRSVYSFQLPIESPEKNQQVESKTPGKHNLLIEKRKQSTGTQEILDKLFSVVNGNEKEKNSGTSLSSLEGGNSKQLGLRRNQSMGMTLKMDIQTQPDLAPSDSERVYPATARNRVIIKRELNKKAVSKEADDVLVKKDKPLQDEYDFNNGVRKSFKIRTTSKDQIILKQEMSLGDKNA